MALLDTLSSILDFKTPIKDYALDPGQLPLPVALAGLAGTIAIGRKNPAIGGALLGAGIGLSNRAEKNRERQRIEAILGMPVEEFNAQQKKFAFDQQLADANAYKNLANTMSIARSPVYQSLPAEDRGAPNIADILPPKASAGTIQDILKLTAPQTKTTDNYTVTTDPFTGKTVRELTGLGAKKLKSSSTKISDTQLYSILSDPNSSPEDRAKAQRMLTFRRAQGPEAESVSFARTRGTKKAEFQAAFPKMRNTMATLNQQWDLVDKKLTKAISEVSPYTAGIGSWLSVIPGTPQKDLSETLKTIRANIGFDKLQQMRADSPTGGALGQVSDLENKLLQSVKASLEQDQSPSQLKENLMGVQKDLHALREIKNTFYKMDYGDFLQSSDKPSTSLTPEQEADKFLRGE